MALNLGVNSFVSSAEADTYFTDRIYSDIWFAGTTTDQDLALVTASGILDRLTYLGTATPTTSYPLSFPRDMVFYDSKFGDKIELNDDRTNSDPGTIPQAIKDATCELALHLLNNISTLADNENGQYPVKDLTLGSVRMTFDTANPRPTITAIPDLVYSMIKQFINENANNTRSVVVNGG